ncbi:MAG: hypothetical protein AAGK92_10370 [Pseudomonadota bacterium]
MSPLLLPLTIPDQSATEYRKELEAFAQMKADLQPRKRRTRWWLIKPRIQAPFAWCALLR